jgi:BTB/POZ domain-containing protein KCTD9
MNYCNELCVKRRAPLETCNLCEELEERARFEAPFILIWKFTGGFLVNRMRFLIEWAIRRNMRRVKAKFKTLFKALLDDEVKIGIFIFVLIFIVVVGLSSFFLYPKDAIDGPLKDILVEAHGLLFDIAVLGIFALWLYKRAEKSREIRRLQDDLEDLSGWREKEAAHRIIGKVRRLNSLGINRFNLHRAFLMEANFNIPSVEILDSNIWDSCLDYARFSQCKHQGNHFLADSMQNTYFDNGKFIDVRFEECNLQNASFLNSDLTGSEFLYCDLQDTRFRLANLTRVDFMESFNLTFEQLKEARTVHMAKNIPKDILEKICKECPELLEEPKGEHPLIQKIKELQDNANSFQ